MANILQLMEGASILVKWRMGLHYEGSTMQGSKLHTKFEFCDFIFTNIYKSLIFLKKNHHKQITHIFES